MVALSDVPSVPQKAQMTRPATDDPGHGTTGRAKKRIADLLRDAWDVRDGGDFWLIRAPMDPPDEWQRWVRIDREWAAMEEWKIKHLKK